MSNHPHRQNVRLTSWTPFLSWRWDRLSPITIKKEVFGKRLFDPSGQNFRKTHIENCSLVTVTALFRSYIKDKLRDIFQQLWSLMQRSFFGESFFVGWNIEIYCMYLPQYSSLYVMLNSLIFENLLNKFEKGQSFLFYLPTSSFKNQMRLNFFMKNDTSTT